MVSSSCRLKISAKFLGMHQTVAKQQEFETGQADKFSAIALRGAQVNAANASIPHTQATTRAVLASIPHTEATTKAVSGEEARKQAEFDRANVLQRFLSETMVEDVGSPTRTIKVGNGLGVDKPRFKDPKTGQMVEIDPFSYSEMGLDENGKVIDKDVFLMFLALTLKNLGELLVIQ